VCEPSCEREVHSAQYKECNYVVCPKSSLSASLDLSSQATFTSTPPQPNPTHQVLDIDLQLYPPNVNAPPTFAGATTARNGIQQLLPAGAARSLQLRSGSRTAQQQRQQQQQQQQQQPQQPQQQQQQQQHSGGGGGGAGTAGHEDADLRAPSLLLQQQSVVESVHDSQPPPSPRRGAHQRTLNSLLNQLRQRQHPPSVGEVQVQLWWAPARARHAFDAVERCR